MNISIAISRIRSALGITQNQFSELTGMSVSMISAVEKGDRMLSDPALENLLKVLILSRDELELIAIENIEEFEERHREVAEATQKWILSAIAAQHNARKSLGMLT